jgi:hypothetical protein
MKEGFQETETKTQMQLHAVHTKIHQQPKKIQSGITSK